MTNTDVEVRALCMRTLRWPVLTNEVVLGAMNEGLKSTNAMYRNAAGRIAAAIAWQLDEPERARKQKEIWAICVHLRNQISQTFLGVLCMQSSHCILVGKAN